MKFLTFPNSGQPRTTSSFLNSCKKRSKWMNQLSQSCINLSPWRIMKKEPGWQHLSSNDIFRHRKTINQTMIIKTRWTWLKTTKVYSSTKMKSNSSTKPHDFLFHPFFPPFHILTTPIPLPENDITSHNNNPNNILINDQPNLPAATSAPPAQTLLHLHLPLHHPSQHQRLVRLSRYCC